MAEDDAANLRTVKFDVGGKLFKTARSLINQHEGTMLARLVSDTWLEDPTKAVFIDRDGDMFAQVLNYLRYGSISLPATISKDMFLRDLDFYGIVPAEGAVKTCTESFACQVAERHEQYNNLEAERARLEAERAKLEEQKESIKLGNDIDALASYCVIQHLHDRLEFKIKTGEDQDKTELLRTAATVYSSQENKGLLQKSLSKFGLHLKALNYEWAGMQLNGIRCISETYTFKLSLL